MKKEIHVDDIEALEASLHTLSHCVTDIDEVLNYCKKHGFFPAIKYYANHKEDLDKKLEAALLADQNIKGIIERVKNGKTNKT